MPEPHSPDEPEASAEEPHAAARDLGDSDSFSTATVEPRVRGSWRPRPKHLGGGRFEILDTLGEGGMGEVFRARDVRLDREVALKRLKAHVLDEHARGRLAREAQAMAQLSHPNVIEVYDVELGDDLVLVMEVVSGPTLAQWMGAGPRPWREALPIFVQAGRGLAAAHEAGLVHRDFKPSNVILGDDGRVRVMDFGLARPPGSSVDDDRSAEGSGPPSSSGRIRDEALTATGMVVGTPAYMAPEQVQGLPADGRADQYAFCVALWQALCGRRPFEGEYVELGRAKLRGPPPWPQAVAVPRRLVAAIRRGLAVEPADRWPAMPHLLGELEDVMRTAPRRLGLALGGFGALAAGAAVAAFVVMGRTPACDDVDTYRRALWGDEQRDAVEAALLGTHTAYAAETWARVEPGLDAYATAWAEARHAACEGSQGPSGADPMLDARLRCLQDRRHGFEALVAALAGAGDPGASTSASEASVAVERLPPLAACDDAERLRDELPLPDDPAAAERVVALREQLARSAALNDLFRCDDALAVLAAIAPDVEALGHAPLRAELRLAEGRATDCAGDYVAAEAALRDAYFLASELRHHAVAARAALSLVGVLAIGQERHDQAMQWSEHARAALSRLGDARLEITWLEQMGTLHYAAGRYDESVAVYERALALLPAEPGRETTKHALLLGLLGSALRVLGRLPDARARHEQALAIAERVLGPDHPEVTGHLVNLGNVHSDLGEPEQAEVLHRRALARLERDRGPTHPATLQATGNLALSLSLQGRIREAIELEERVVAGFEAGMGPDHPEVAMALNNLGIDQLGLGDVEGATRSHRRALEIREQALGPEHMLTAASLSNLADAELAAGHAAAARRGYERALPVFERALGRDAPSLSYPLVGLGRALLAEGDPEAALAPLERGLALRERGGMPPELFEARFELARALWDSGQDRSRALELARLALALVEGVEGGEPFRDRAKAWLRERSR